MNSIYNARLKEFNTHEVDEHKQVVQILEEYNTCRYIYICIADGICVHIGQSSAEKKGIRCKIMFKGYSPSGHMKDLLIALAVLNANVVERYIIPVTDESIDLDEKEQEIQKKLHFGQNGSLPDQFEALYRKRLEKLGEKDMRDESEVARAFINTIISNPSGSEWGKMKVWLREWENVIPGITGYITKLVGEWLNLDTKRKVSTAENQKKIVRSEPYQKQKNKRSQYPSYDSVFAGQFPLRLTAQCNGIDYTARLNANLSVEMNDNTYASLNKAAKAIGSRKDSPWEFWHHNDRPLIVYRNAVVPDSQLTPWMREYGRDVT